MHRPHGVEHGRVRREPDLHLERPILAAGPSRAPVGPVRLHQAAWLDRARDLNDESGVAAPVVELALRQGFVVSRRAVEELGVAPSVARRLVRRGTWTAPRFGVLCVLPAGPGTADEVRASAAALVWRDAVISYASAAVVHGLPLLKPPGPPTLTVRHDLRAYSFEDIRVHVAAIDGADVTDWFGAPVTTTARSIVDLARARGLAAGVVAADAALHEHLVTIRQLDDALARQRRWPGVRTARRAIGLADARAESPLESLTRLCFVRSNVRQPELQAWVDTPGGRYRVDFLWPDVKVIVEVDGLLKYRDWRALADEKRRQEHLERAGYRVIRLLWEDVVRHSEATIARVRGALVR
jgi:very-short-patch-repair endonuclease/predicted transcriptional regulator of viral defense system